MAKNQAYAQNVSLSFYQVMLAGFVIHLVGIFSDAGMVIRVKYTNKLYGIIALVLVCAYTAAWIAWLIWLIVMRF